MSSQAETIARANERPSDAEIQNMLAQAVRLYAERASERDDTLPAFPGDAPMTATEVMVTVTPAVLTWVTRTKSAWLGFIYLFAFSLGMCALLVAVGLSSGAVARLPRAGLWMVRVKKVFAFVMVGAAEYYLVKMGQGLL